MGVVLGWVGGNVLFGVHVCTRRSGQWTHHRVRPPSVWRQSVVETVSTVPAESSPNCSKKPQLRLSRDELRPACVFVTEPSSWRDDRFKMYSGSGAALVRASKQGWSVEPTARRQTNRQRPSPCSNPELSALSGDSVKPGQQRQQHTGKPTIDKCWALCRRRAEASSDAKVDNKRSSNFFFVSVCQPARADGGWAPVQQQQQQSRSRMNSLMAVWRKYRRRRRRRRRRPSNCHGVVLICEFAAETKTGGITRVTREKRGTNRVSLHLRTGLSRPRLYCR